MASIVSFSKRSYILGQVSLNLVLPSFSKIQYKHICLIPSQHCVIYNRICCSLYYFSATIARNKERFWVNVQSEPVMDETDSSSVVTQSCPPRKTIYTDPYKTGAASNVHRTFIPTCFTLFVLVFKLIH